MPNIEGALIEIIERTDSPDPGFIVPNEIRINGTPLYCPDDEPITVHEMEIESRDVVKVTLTLLAKRVTIAAEPKAVA